MDDHIHIGRVQHGQSLRDETAHAGAAEDPEHAARDLECPMGATLARVDAGTLERRAQVGDDRFVLAGLHGDRQMRGLAAPRDRDEARHGSDDEHPDEHDEEPDRRRVAA